MTEVRILLERIEGGWVANAHDEVGKISAPFAVTREDAITKAQKASRKVLGGAEEILFKVEEL